MSTSTAVLLLAAAWIGSLVGLRGGLLPAVGAAACATAVGVLVAGTAAWAARRGTGPAGDDGGRPGPPVRSVALVVAAGAAVLLVALAGAAVRADAIRDGPLAAHVADAPRTVTAHVVLVDDVRTPPDGRPWAVGRVRVIDPAAGPPVASRERVLLRLPASARLAFGATYAVDALASAIDGSAAAWFASQGVVVALDVRAHRPLSPAPGWQAATTWLRDRVSSAAHEHLPVAHASLLTGLVTGDIRGQPEAVGDAVLAAGLSHLTAVSGSNVAVVVGGVLGLCLVSGIGRRAAWWACLVAIWWFAVLVRAEPSVVRASVLATLVLLALLVGRVRRTPALLAATGLVALLADPLLAARPGFALSMAATAGVLLVTPGLDAWLSAHTGLPAAPRLVLAATCGAQLAVTPLLLGIGGAVHPASVPANLIAVPAAAIASAAGGVAALVATVWVEGAAVVAGASRPALAVVLWSARTFAGAPGRQAALGLVGLAIAVVAVRSWPALPAVARRAVPAAAVAGIIAVVGLPGPPGTLPDAPVLVVLDVGQGDAVLLGDPAAGWILVDGGPDPAVLAEALAEAGVAALSAVIASHPHADHTAGLVHPLADLDVGALLVGPRGRQDGALLAAAGEVPVVDVAAGDSWVHGGMQLTVLSPPATGLGEEPNDNSLVIRVDVAGGRSVLLTGDAEVVPQVLLADDPRIDVDVLKVPHHGGATNAEGFLAATTPQLAVISVGADNGFGHPHPDVLGDLTGVEVRRTDLDGDLAVPLGGS